MEHEPFGLFMLRQFGESTPLPGAWRTGLLGGGLTSGSGFSSCSGGGAGWLPVITKDDAKLFLEGTGGLVCGCGTRTFRVF